MKQVLTTCVVAGLVLALGSVSQAADIQWTGAADNLWSNPLNWDTGFVPDGTQEVLIDVPWAAAPNGPVIQDGDAAVADGMLTEAAGIPVLNITGGTLDIADYVWWGDGTDSYAVWNQSGGVVTVADVFELGWGDGAGTLNLTGGVLTVGRFKNPTGSGTFAQANIHGGTVNVTKAGGLDFGNENGAMEFDGSGTLVLEGDDAAKIAGLIGSGQITGAGGATVLYDYNITNAGKTTVMVPEPAALSLLALGSIALLRRRRA